MNTKNYLTSKEVQELLNLSVKVILRIANNNNWDKYINKSKHYFLEDDVRRYMKMLDNLKSHYMPSKDAISYLETTSSSFSRLTSTTNWEFIEEKNTKYYKIEDIKSYKKKLDLLNSKKFLNTIDAANYIGKTPTQLRRIVKKFEITKNCINGIVVYNSDELDKYIEIKQKAYAPKKESLQTIKKNNEDKYIYYKNALILLNLDNLTFDRLMEEYNYKNRIVISSDYKFIEKKLIEKLQLMQKLFWSENYTGSEAIKKLPKRLFKQMIPNPIPLYAMQKKFRGNCNQCAYKKSEVNLKLKLFSNPESYGYISSVKAKQILDLSKEIFLKVEREYGLFSFYISDNTKYYLKEEIDFFKDQQNALGISYLTSTMASTEYGNLRFLGRGLLGFKIPTFCRTSQVLSNDLCYRREDIESYIKKTTVQNMFGETDIDTFLMRFNIKSKNFPFLNSSLYTKNKWIDYVSTKLSNSEKSSNKTRYTLVKSFLTCTSNLENLMCSNNVKEIYSLTTKEVNFWFKGISNEKNRVLIYYFLESISVDIKIRIKSIQEKNKGFLFKDILKYDDKVFESTKKELHIDSESIYSYEEYINLFKHLINVELHANRSLDKITNNDDISYLSCWLYLLIHLNNGWRHGDISRFPRIYLLDLLDEWGIYSLNWFNTNKLSVAQSRRIISRIVQYDFRISKTEVYGHFFCSDKLAPAISTAIIMLECYYKYHFVGDAPKFDEPLMKFALTKFNEPKNAIISSCIDGANLKNFKFATRKMNKTILTFIYNVACELFPSGYNALILPQSLRSHIDKMSTIEYIQFNSKQLEFLSGELFARGEFGFITDCLLNLISNKPTKSITRTTEIKYINDLFGDYKKIEATLKMLNNFKNEKTEISNILNEKNYEECIEIITHVFLGNMPSKQTGIQCLFSKDGCKYPNVCCENCRYQIPSIYILRTICLSLKEELISYNSTRHIGKKIKLSSKIHRYVDILLEAINKYGQDYVYNCLDISRVDFLQMFDAIDSVENLLKLQE